MSVITGLIMGVPIGMLIMVFIQASAHVNDEHRHPDEIVQDTNDFMGTPKTLKQAVMRDASERVIAPAHTCDFLRQKFGVAYLRSFGPSLTHLRVLARELGIENHDEYCALSGCEICEGAK